MKKQKAVLNHITRTMTFCLVLLISITLLFPFQAALGSDTAFISDEPTPSSEQPLLSSEDTSESPETQTPPADDNQNEPSDNTKSDTNTQNPSDTVSSTDDAAPADETNDDDDSDDDNQYFNPVNPQGGGGPIGADPGVGTSVPIGDDFMADPEQSESESMTCPEEITIPSAFIDSIQPNPALTGSSIEFSGHGTYTYGTIQGYQWISNLDGELSTQATFTTSMLSHGIHLILFSVCSTSGTWSEEASQLIIVHNAPIAEINGAPFFGWKQKPILFDGSHSYDSDGTINRYHWNFGDETTDTGSQIMHSYTRSGTYTVTLTVTDNYGAIDTITTTATIVGHSPTARTNGPYFGELNTEILFDGSGSTDNDGTITAYSWDLGDTTKGTGKNLTHSYNTTGTFIVSLTVTDDEGKKGSDVTFVVITTPNTSPERPQIQTTPSEEKATWKITAKATDPNDDFIRYVFLWGDGTETLSPFYASGTTVTVSHTWLTPGVYTISVYVEDSKNLQSDAVTTSVFVVNGILDIDVIDDETTPAHHSSDVKTSSLFGVSFASSQLSMIVTGITLALTITIGLIVLLYRKRYF